MQYFKHMSNMRHDLKIKKLILKYGIEGYGWYNLILETISEKLSTQKPMPELEESCEDLALCYNGNTTKINEIICYMINNGLLELNDLNARVMCNKIFKYLDSSQTKSEELKNMIKKYKEIIVFEASQTFSDFPVEKRKEENRIEKNIYGSLSNVFLLQDDYTKLTNDYNKTLIDNYIERLSLYIPNKKPPAYKDHNAVIRAWLNKDNVKKIIDNSKNNDNMPVFNYKPIEVDSI